MVTLLIITVFMIGDFDNVDDPYSISYWVYDNDTFDDYRIYDYTITESEVYGIYYSGNDSNYIYDNDVIYDNTWRLYKDGNLVNTTEYEYTIYNINYTTSSIPDQAVITQDPTFSFDTHVPDGEGGLKVYEPFESLTNYIDSIFGDIDITWFGQ